jgi:deaminated glutathione amidase
MKLVVKKRRPKDRLFRKLADRLSGAGRRVVVVASGNNDTGDHSSSCEDGDDNAATTAELAFFLGSTSALHLGSDGLCRCSSLSNHRGTGESNSSNCSERDFTETHFFGSFFECGFHTPAPHWHNHAGKATRESAIKLKNFILSLLIVKLLQQRHSWNSSLSCTHSNAGIVARTTFITTPALSQTNTGERHQRSNMRIAIHQMSSGIDPMANLRRMSAAIAEAGRGGAQAYFAPEMSVLLDRDRTRASAVIGKEQGSAWVPILANAAREVGLCVHMGSMPVIAEDNSARFRNRTLLLDTSGNVRARYDKMHLFDVDLASGESWRESSAYEAGTAPVIAESPLGPLGLAICYDMRFPELFAQFAKAGVRALAIPSAFTVPTGKAHWHTLLRARAIESAAFVIASAQSGKHEDGRETYGHSLVVDPWGEILLDMGEGEGLGFVDIDLARVDEVRAQIPVHLNRRDIPTVG